MAGGYVRTTVLFCRLWAKVHQITRDRNLQRRFPVVNITFRSGDILDRSAKSSEIAPKSMFSVPNFLEGGPQILDLVFKIAPISDHVAKFRGDRLRDRGDLALKRNKKGQLSLTNPRDACEKFARFT